MAAELMEQREDKWEQEKLRLGECHGCGRCFAWTGALSQCPPCGGCGRVHDKVDFPHVLSKRAAKVLLGVGR